MFRTIILLCLFSVGAYTQDMVIVTDSLSRAQIIRNLVKQYPQWENTEGEHIVIERFWRDVLKIRVLWGLNRDPVPPPFEYYTAPGGIIVSGFLSVLQSRQYPPETPEETLDLAVLIIRDEHRYALPCMTDGDLKKVPKKIRKKYRVHPARVEELKESGYLVTLFTYQTAQSHSFTRHFRPEQLTKHTIVARDGTWEWVPEILYTSP